MSEIKVDVVSPYTGTGLQIGESGDTVTVPSGATLAVASGATLANAGTATGFGGGKIVQVVNVQTGAYITTTTLSPIGDTIPQNNEGGEMMTLAVTPTNISNKLRIEAVIGSVGNPGNIQYYTLALFQDTTANALACSNATASVTGHDVYMGVTHFMAAGTTSSTTFKVRIGGHQAGTTAINGNYGSRTMGGVTASSITIMEIEV